MVTFDQETQTTLKYTFSNNGGTSWSTLAYLNNGHHPNMDAYGGYAHLVYEWGDAKSTGYRRRDGNFWTPAEKCTPDTRWQGWVDVAVDTNGVVHIVYDRDSEEELQCRRQWNYQEVTGTVGASGEVSVFLWVWHQNNPPGTCWFDGASLTVR